MQMNSCKKCNESINGNYCSNCGQATKLERIDRHYIIREMANSFNLDRGMFYTVKKMLINPGESVKEYIEKDRSRYVKPVTFVIITSLIYTIVSHFFQIDASEFQQQLPGEIEPIESPTSVIFTNWVINYSGYVNIITILLMAFGVKLFFRKYGYNFFEIFILFCYIWGTSTLFSSVFFVIQGITHLSLIYPTTLIAMIYSIWATGQFFDKRKVGSYIKSSLSYVLAWLILSISLVIVLTFIDHMLTK